MVINKSIKKLLTTLLIAITLYLNYQILNKKIQGLRLDHALSLNPPLFTVCRREEVFYILKFDQYLILLFPIESSRK